MLRKPVSTVDTPIVRAVNEIGDGWMILIIWAIGRDVRRFDDLQRELGVARNILSERLRRLIDVDVLVKAPICEGARRKEYRLTDKGAALSGALDALYAWGSDWAAIDGDRQLEAAE